MHTVAARSVAEQPRLLHRRLNGSKELCQYSLIQQLWYLYTANSKIKTAPEQITKKAPEQIETFSVRVHTMWQNNRAYFTVVSMAARSRILEKTSEMTLSITYPHYSRESFVFRFD